MTEPEEYRRFAVEQAKRALAAVADGGQHAEQSADYQLGYVASALRRLVDACDQERVAGALRLLGDTEQGRAYAETVIQHLNLNPERRHTP